MSKNIIKDFTFQLSNKEKIYLKRNIDDNKFNKKILVTNLKKILYIRKNSIMQSLYKSATDQKIPANIIIEFAEFMDFKLTFKEILEKKILFK